MSTSRRFLRGAALTAAVTATGLATAGIASAHVTANVYGAELEQGGYGAIVLRVPNEEEKAGTTKVELTLSAEYGITSARTKPVAGWTAKVSESDDVVTTITWTAEPGHEIAAGTTSYQEFPLTLGKLPKDVDTLVLPAAQTYSDGTVVRWDDPPTDTGAEPEHPAPVVTLTEPSGEGHGAAQAANESTDGHDQAASGDTAPDDTARWIAGAGLALGALGLGFGVGAIVLVRKAGKSS